MLFHLPRHINRPSAENVGKVMRQLTLAGVIKAPAPLRSFSYISILGFPFVEPADLPCSLSSRTRRRV
uniref:Uncharacterized protein n=1 Tax=Arundo donax TaxID=35708 RepID=A0A0A9DTT1_ARUDO